MKRVRLMKSENVRGYDNMVHIVDNLLDRGAENVNFHFDTYKECYVVTWKEKDGNEKS